MFKCCGTKGFHITFANGWTASVQWGVGNYCANKDYSREDYMHGSPCPDAEIMAWGPDGPKEAVHVFERTVYDEGTEDEFVSERTVMGWCKPDEVLKFLNEIANKPKVTP